MDAHAWKRHVSTMRANVYVVSDWCGVRSFDPCVRFKTGHVIHVSRCALTVGPRSMCLGSVLAAPLRVHIIIIIVITFIIFDGS